MTKFNITLDKIIEAENLSEAYRKAGEYLLSKAKIESDATSSAPPFPASAGASSGADTVSSFPVSAPDSLSKPQTSTILRKL